MTAHPPRPRACHSVGSWISFLLVWSVVAASSSTGAGEDASLEYRVKAAFLFNFTKFIEWPASVFPQTTSPIVIGVIGDELFLQVLTQAIQGKTINGRELTVRRVGIEEAAGCQVLFVSATEKDRLAQIFARLKNVSVLTVGETDTFVQEGGMIRFVTLDNKVRFEIAAAAAERARLKISSKLLKLGTSAKGEAK